MKTSRAVASAALLGLASASCSTGQSTTLITSTTTAPTTAPTGTKYLITLYMTFSYPIPLTTQARADTDLFRLKNSGDSYSQTGFNINSTKPSAANPIGNPPLPGWTASGGLNWVGFLASRLNTSLLLTYNFAYGGATTSADLVKPYEPTVLSFVDQVKEFGASVAAKPDYAPWTAENALFGVWIGVNDVGNTFWLGNVSETTFKIMDVYFAQLQVMYDAGARRFAILSVPPIEKTPAQLAQGSDWSTETEARVIGEYNALLAGRLANFTRDNAGIIDAKVVDTQAPFNAALADPAKYGAPNATCYNADGVSCLWFNDYHPGVAINRLVAEAVVEEFKGSFF